jgi:uncharacterized SAM-binding protein YcdF (DUF218 family)
MPLYCHASGDGLGFTASQSQASGGQRFSFPAGAIGIKSLIAADSPAVVVLARPLQGSQAAAGVGRTIGEGAHYSAGGVTTAGRLTQVAWLAKKIVLPHASPGGSLAEQLGQLRLDGRQVEVLLAS